MTQLPNGVTLRICCRGCNSKNLVKVLDLGPMPLAGGFVKPENFQDELKIPLELFVCVDCKLAQICHIIDPDILFRNYFYISSVIGSLSLHFQEYAEFLKGTYLADPGSKLLEMGCNDGVLLQYFQGNSNISSLGVDPSENVSKMAQDKGLEVINDFFNTVSATEIVGKYGQFDVLTGSNMFAHIDDIIEIINAAKIVLKEEGVFIFEVHYLLDLLREFQYDTIYHEHLTYYSILSIEKIFALQGMKIVDVIHLEMHGGGIRVITARNESRYAISPVVNTFLSEERAFGLENIELYKKMGEQVVHHKEELTSLLDSLKSQGKSIVGYGAPGRGTILLNYCNITPETLDYIVDVSPLRKGMCMPGVHIPIVDPEIARKDPPDYFLVLAWNYLDSILSQESELRNTGTKFITPFPRVEIH